MSLNVSCMVFIFCHVGPLHGSDVPYWTVIYERAGCVSAPSSVSLSTTAASPYEPKSAPTVLLTGHTTRNALVYYQKISLEKFHILFLHFFLEVGSKKKNLRVPW